MSPGSRRSRPAPWAEHRAQFRSSPLLSFHRLEWCFSWVAWALGNWAFLEVLNHLGSFSVLIAVIFYFVDSGNRMKQKHYQAWQVVNSAQGKGGNGGRIEALQELSHDGVSLVGVDANGAFLQGIRLEHADVSRCDLHASDLRDSTFTRATLSQCNLQQANFRNADLSGANLDDADLSGADLHGANLRAVSIVGADFSDTDLSEADIQGVDWSGIASMKSANIRGVRNASPAYLAFAKSHGAVVEAADDGGTPAEGSVPEP